MDEIQNYTDKSISIIDGKKWNDSHCVILNYDILKNFHGMKKGEESKIMDSNFDLVIWTKAPLIQNKKTKGQK